MDSSSGDPSLKRVLEDIASAPAGFGGGAVAAACLALAANLLAVAAGAASPDWTEAEGAVAQAALLQDRAAQLAEENLAAYSWARSALRHSGGSPASDDVLGQALARAADIPLAIGAAAADTAELAVLVAAKGNPDRRPDALAVASISEAVANVAVVLVEANLGVTRTDARLREARANAEDAREAAQQATAG